MHEADLLCDRVTVLHEGRVLATSTSAALKRMFGGARNVTLELDREPGAVRGELERLLGKEGRDVEKVEFEGRELRFRSSNAEELVAQLTSAVIRLGIGIVRLNVREVTLEEAFLGMVGQSDAAHKEDEEGLE